MALHEGERLDTIAAPPAPPSAFETDLPTLNPELLSELRAAGWKRVGIMVAILDSVGDILMLSHHARRKNHQDMLGPLGETTQQFGTRIEQPLETLYRGIQEELMVGRPEELMLRMPAHNAWVANNWPRGTAHPGEFSYAISFPVLIDDSIRERVTGNTHSGPEICAGQFMSPECIANTPSAQLRPGVVEWLAQLQSADLLTPKPSDTVVIPFDTPLLYSAPGTDINLDQW